MFEECVLKYIDTYSDVHYHISLYLFEPLTSHRILFLFYALLSEPVVALF